MSKWQLTGRAVLTGLVRTILGVQSDYGNNRVLIWKSPIGTVQGAPDIVLGQADFNSGGVNSGGISASSFNGPGTFCTDGTRLFVPDQGNSRILMWNHFPTANHQAADLVLGQANFTANSANQGLSNPTAQTIKRANWCQVVNGKLIVADTDNFRVLIWNSFPTQMQQAADLVVGQVDMNSAVSGTTAQNISAVDGVYTDGTKLYVTDQGNARILIWDTIPTVTGQAADLVIGQANMTANGVSAATLLAQGVLVAANRLFVADRGHHRVLVWNTVPTMNGQAPDLVLGQLNMTAVSVNQGGAVTAQTMNEPVDLAYDGTRLFVSDISNNRILGFNGLPTVTDQAADFVFGQADFISNSANQGGSITALSLNLPHGLLYGTFLSR